MPGPTRTGRGATSDESPASLEEAVFGGGDAASPEASAAAIEAPRESSPVPSFDESVEVAGSVPHKSEGLARYERAVREQWVANLMPEDQEPFERMLREGKVEFIEI